MSTTKVDLLQRQTAFDGHFRIDRYVLRHTLHAGGLSQPIVREVFERGQVAAVLPVDAARERVVLIEQFRVGAYANGWDPWLLECVAGIIEDGEDAEQVCRREADEEAGCVVTDLIPIACYLSSPGACSETVALYCGRVDSEGVGGIHGLDHESEDIKVSTVSFDDAAALLDAGRIVNAKTIIALQWLASHRDLVKERWGR